MVVYRLIWISLLRVLRLGAMLLHACFQRGKRTGVDGGLRDREVRHCGMAGSASCTKHHQNDVPTVIVDAHGREEHLCVSGATQRHFVQILVEHRQGLEQHESLG